MTHKNAHTYRHTPGPTHTHTNSLTTTKKWQIPLHYLGHKLKLAKHICAAKLLRKHMIMMSLPCIAYFLGPENDNSWQGERVDWVGVAAAKIAFCHICCRYFAYIEFNELPPVRLCVGFGFSLAF